jgi:hypothetical protein
MGYTTEFQGSFDLTPVLNADQVEYLKQFALTRRMKRNPEIASNRQDPKREAVSLPIGKDGEYFVGGLGYGGQNHDDSIVEYNKPPSTQPGLWCKWIPSDAGDFIVWDEGEKFYKYIEWLQYIIDNFLKPWGIEANGTVKWRGERFEDIGTILVKNNIVTVEGH